MITEKSKHNLYSDSNDSKHSPLKFIIFIPVTRFFWGGSRKSFQHNKVSNTAVFSGAIRGHYKLIIALKYFISNNKVLEIYPLDGIWHRLKEGLMMLK
jgi:hypothetical protein